MSRSRANTVRTFAVLAGLVPLMTTGCFRYNTEVENTSAQSVQVQILKGRYKREIGNAVLAPGGSVGWDGATNGPVVARVTSAGEVYDVRLPRRALTEINVSAAGVGYSIAGAEQETHRANEDQPADSWDTGSEPADTWDEPVDDTPTDDASEGEMIDLIESDG